MVVLQFIFVLQPLNTKGKAFGIYGEKVKKQEKTASKRR